MHIYSRNVFLNSFFYSIDELQYVTVTGCSSTLASKAITIVMVGNVTYNLASVTFNCDDDAATVRANIKQSTGLNVHVAIVDKSTVAVTKAQVNKYMFRFIHMDLYMFIYSYIHRLFNVNRLKDLKNIFNS